MRVYLDTCALNRLWDDRSQPRVAREATAVATILLLVEEGELRWLGSQVLRRELGEARDKSQLLRSAAALELVSEWIPETSSTRRLAETLASDGFGRNDALHLACALEAGSGSVITTDDRLLARARRTRMLRDLPVMLPDEFLRRIRR